MNSSKDEKNDRKAINIWWLVLIGLVGLGVSALALWFYFNTFNGALSNDRNAWGVFGDFIGGSLSPILAFLGLIALLITIGLQSKELVYARVELKRSAKALEEQGASLKKQNFENTFFQLLRLHNEIVSDLDLREKKDQKVISRGRDCFREWKKALTRRMKNFSVTEKSEVKVIQKAYDDFYSSFDSDVGHYFRNLYRILKFVDESDLLNPSFYTGLVRAQLSSDEQFLLFYNGLSTYGDKSKELIEKYSLLEHLDSSNLFDEKKSGISL